MTEDDTVRILKRPSFRELLEKFRNLEWLEKEQVLVNYTTRDTWMRKYGWSIEEYQHQLTQNR